MAALRPGASPWSLALLLVVTSCRQANVQPAPSEQPSGEPSAPTRVHEQEKQLLYGLQLPENFRITRRFDDTTHLTTPLPLSKTVSFFKDHLLAQHAEIDAKRTRFPRAYMKTDPSRRLLSVELTPRRGGTQVRVRDITPPPITQGLSSEERWKQAGRNPDGSLEDRSRVY